RVPMIKGRFDLPSGLIHGLPEIEEGLDGNAFTIRANVLALVGRAAPLLGLGSQLRWFSFRRLVRAGEVWIFQIENQNAGAIIPWLGFRVAELIG
ncbi:MAG: hypothetical protein EBS48_11030, partial [Actinobacteria bacterium]|nr:hypothetical protein [Actinomycetota bacterium]